MKEWEEAIKSSSWYRKIGELYAKTQATDSVDFEHSLLNLEALIRFESLWMALKKARLTDEERSNIHNLLHAIEQSYKRIVVDRDQWANTAAVLGRK